MYSIIVMVTISFLGGAYVNWTDPMSCGTLFQRIRGCFWMGLFFAMFGGPFGALTGTIVTDHMPKRIVTRVYMIKPMPVGAQGEQAFVAVRRSEAGTSVISFYYFNEDGTTSLIDLPASETVRIDEIQGDAQAIYLRTHMEADAGSRWAKFAIKSPRQTVIYQHELRVPVGTISR